MNISTTFLNALKHTSSDVEGQRSPEILLGQIYKVSLEDKSFLLPLAGGEFRLSDPFYYEWNPFPSYLLLYTLEGSAVLTTRGSEVVLDHEHLLFLDCSQGFSLRLLQGKWRFQMFFLSGAELSSYYSIFQAAFTCCYPIPIGSSVSQRMQQLTKFSFTPTPAEQIQLHRELTDMFVELMLSALSVSRDVKPIPAYLLSMKADFEENYAENHSLEYFEQTFLHKFDSATTVGLLLTLILIFMFQGEVVLDNPLHIILIAVPLIIQTFFIFFLAFGVCRIIRLPYDITAPAGMIGASNFFELAVAVAVALFGTSSPAALATTVGVLTEVPVMLTLVKIANKLKEKFKYE